MDGFKAISLQTYTHSAEHQLFVKKHVLRNHTPDKPPDRTLFVLNIPPYITEKCLRREFSTAGKVQTVSFQAKPSPKDTTSDTDLGGFKVGYVVFKDPNSVNKALNMTSLYVPSDSLTVGMKKWMMEYNEKICDQNKLAAEINQYVFRLDKKLEKEKKQNSKKDGGEWTVVTKKGKNRGLARKESIRNKINEKISEQEKRKHLTDFYVFQKRESKMNHLVEMRKRYEEDKKKVTAMKQARKFKPY